MIVLLYSFTVLGCAWLCIAVLLFVEYTTISSSQVVVVWGDAKANYNKQAIMYMGHYTTNTKAYYWSILVRSCLAAMGSFLLAFLAVAGGGSCVISYGARR